MTKNDIQNGMILIYRNGRCGLVVDTPIGKLIQLGNMFGDMSFISDDLRYNGAIRPHGYDVMEIKSIASPEHVIGQNISSAPSIWTRVEVIAQITRQGHKLKAICRKTI